MSLLDRRGAPTLLSELDFERRGQAPNVCFAEAIVYFNQRWFLYYGCADSAVGVCAGN